MQHKLLVVIAVLCASVVYSQGVAISGDNSAPDPKAMLDIKSTSKGILFPSMTTMQRNSIQEPPHGLHIFNITTGSLEYYDTEFRGWVSYCPDCMPATDTLSNNQSGYTLPSSFASARKIIIVVMPGVVISGNGSGSVYAIDLSVASPSTVIILKNYGTIAGLGGIGGSGGHVAISPCTTSQGYGNPGMTGYSAINSRPGTSLLVYNYGIIGGGGGGGGGGAAGGEYPNTGGGGGAGIPSGSGGSKGYVTQWYSQYSSCLATNTIGNGADGQPGTASAGGAGGAGGQSGIPLLHGAYGGNGGGLGQAGQNGLDSWYSPGGQGGLAGKAIQGNAGGNVLINTGGGTVYGSID